MRPSAFKDNSEPKDELDQLLLHAQRQNYED